MKVTDIEKQSNLPSLIFTGKVRAYPQILDLVREEPTPMKPLTGQK